LTDGYIRKERFQSTPPVWGATNFIAMAPQRRAYFNPRPPCGGRRAGRWEVAWGDLFQSTPPVWGATLPGYGHARSSVISIHAPRVGGDGLADHAHFALQISIHAPRVGGDSKNCQ